MPLAEEVEQYRIVLTTDIDGIGADLGNIAEPKLTVSHSQVVQIHDGGAAVMQAAISQIGDYSHSRPLMIFIPVKI